MIPMIPPFSSSIDSVWYGCLVVTYYSSLYPCTRSIVVLLAVSPAGCKYDRVRLWIDQYFEVFIFIRAATAAACLYQ